MTTEKPGWNGSPSGLLELLPGIGVAANVLTRRLNVSAERLYNDYGICYESKRIHSGRNVYLKLIQTEA